MKEKYKKNMVLRALLFVALGILLLPIVNAQEPPVEEESKDCIVYSFTSSENYNFLISNNSKHFGSSITIIHNCEFVQLDIEGQFYARSNNSFAIEITAGFHNLTFSTEDGSYNYMIEIFPDRLEWETEYNLLFENPRTEFISIDTSNSRENWASILSIVVVWVLTVYVYWKLIESYTNNNFIEEVVK